MEIKKSPKADLQNKRGLLLEIGLIIALSAVIVTFSITPKEHRIEQIDLEYTPVEEEITEITREPPKQQEAPRKVEVKVITDIIEIMDNDAKIETDVDFFDFDQETEVIQVVEIEEEVIEDDQPFLVAETMPKFQGGDLNTFRAWVQQNVKFPQIAMENEIQGRVVLSFVIEKDGRLTNIQVLQTPDRSLSEEAIRVLSKSPKWTPGKQRNQVVRVKYTLPVDFRLQH